MTSSGQTNRGFLTDVITLAFVAFGGPTAHIAMFFERLVEKRGYVTSDELVELNALCSILPGPTSTQTLVAVAYKLGGLKLAVLTLILWLTPAGLLMMGPALLLHVGQQLVIDLEFLRFLPPVAVGFVFFAAFGISKKVIKSSFGLILMLAGAGVTFSVVYFFDRSLWTAFMFPGLLLLAGAVHAWVKSGEGSAEPLGKLQWNWKPLLLCIGLYGVLFAGTMVVEWRLLDIAEKMYRSGTLVFGGGQVLIPLLENEMVTASGYLTHEEFLNGVAVVQVAPGPVFSMSSFIGTLGMSEYGVGMMVLGGVAGLIGLFLPGLLLVVFAYNNWEKLKSWPAVERALPGINAMASGFVWSAGVLLFLSVLALSGDNPQIWIPGGVVAGTLVLLFTKKVPGPVIVLVALGVGVLMEVV